MRLLWENFADRRKFEETLTNNTCDEEKIATFVGKSRPSD